MGTTLAATTGTAGGTMRTVQAIVAAGLVCGTLDGISALIASGGNWLRLFQFIASGALGPDSFKDGVKTALLGIAFHYLIAFTATVVFYAASRGFPLLLDRALLFGVLYGICVDLFMSFLVVPMSAIGRRPFHLQSFAIYLGIHMVVVGPSIALTLRRFLR
jgi:hypothetical protein